MIISVHIPQLKANEHDGRELVAMKGDLRLFLSKLLKRYFMYTFYVQMKQLNKLDLKKTVVSTHSISFHRGKAWKLQI